MTPIRNISGFVCHPADYAGYGTVSTDPGIPARNGERTLLGAETGVGDRGGGARPDGGTGNFVSRGTGGSVVDLV